MLKSKRNYKPGKMDECQTPGYALDPIEQYLFKSNIYFDPACGEELLLCSLQERGFTVFGSDIKDGKDFLEIEGVDEDVVIITNPPFSLKYDFLEMCYELERPFALLMPVETIGSKTAQTSFRMFGIEVVWFDQRVNFKKIIF